MILNNDDFADAMAVAFLEAAKPSGTARRITIFMPEKSVTISKCYHECPFFRLDGGPSPVMYCGHPSLVGKGQEAAFIISHPDCDTGFPKKCPLVLEVTEELAHETR